MKKLFIIFGVILTLIAFVLAQAQETELTKTVGDIELEINENGVAAVTQNIELLAHAAVYQADITIPNAKNIEISDPGGRLEYDSIIADEEETINFYFSKPLIAGERRNITIKYSTEFFTNKQEDTWELSFFLIVSNKSTVRVIFPESVMISFTSSEIIPSTYIENSRQVLELKSEGDKIDFLCEYRFKEKELIETQKENQTGTQINQTVNETKNETKKQEPITPEVPYNDYVLILFIIIIIIILAALMYFAYYLKFKKLKNPGTEEDEEEEKKEIKEPEKPNKIKPAIFKVLNEDEKKVVEILQSADDEITQAYIHKSTQIPRSTLSKVMFRLEERNIIERRSEGKTKWIRLKKWVFE